MSEKFTIDSETTISSLTLAVGDLEMMTRYYQEIIGFELLERSGSGARLGVGELEILRLVSEPAGTQSKQTSGLFHFAILVPTRPALGQWLRHYIRSMNRMIDGAGDHLVSEALYLDDPEGNGIEVYWDRPRSEWTYLGDRIKMDTLAVDLPALVKQADERPFEGLPAGTTLGHIHLQVHDVKAAVDFYSDRLGFPYMTGMPSAAFMGAGGYHHHIGANTWRSLGRKRGVEAAGGLGLRRFEIELPNQQSATALTNQLDMAQVEITITDGWPTVTDPSGNKLQITYRS